MTVRSSYRLPGPVKTVDGSVPEVPGARVTVSAVVSGEAFRVRDTNLSFEVTATLLTVGGVLSYFKWNASPSLWLPALSVQPPVIATSALSGPLYVVEVHEPMPEPPSLPRYVTVTGWLYQPLLSGGRSGLAPSTCGALAS